MAFKDSLKIARKAQGLSQSELAEHLGGGKDVVYRIEAGLMDATPAQVAAAARVLGDPGLLVQHCDACPVATALLPVRYPSLDNVPTHPAIVAHKLAEECREAAQASETLFKVFDRLDWQDDAEAVAQAVEQIGQIRDVEVGIQILYRALFLGSLLPLEMLEQIQSRHRKKCEERGYCKPTRESPDEWVEYEAAAGAE